MKRIIVIALVLCAIQLQAQQARFSAADFAVYSETFSQSMQVQSVMQPVAPVAAVSISTPALPEVLSSQHKTEANVAVQEELLAGRIAGKADNKHGLNRFFHRKK